MIKQLFMSNSTSKLIALCDDGTVWCIDVWPIEGRWTQLPAIPGGH